MILREAGVFFTHEQELGEERGGHKGTYNWLHMPSGQLGTRDVWVLTDVLGFGLTALLDHWNRAPEWKYWSVT